MDLMFNKVKKLKQYRKFMNSLFIYEMFYSKEFHIFMNRIFINNKGAKYGFSR